MNTSMFSKEQIAGQRLMAGFDGTGLNTDLKFLIGTLKVGGIILFSRNLSSPDQIKGMCVSMQEYAKSCGQPPLFIAIDQEGGEVARLKEPFTQFPAGNPGMRGEKDAEAFAWITAQELKNVGINMNLAPVLDVPPEGFKSVMDKRVFGKAPAWVSRLGLTVIEHLQRNEIMAVAKHFPGIGRTTLDSHLDMPFLDVSLSEMETSDLIPFKAAIHHGVSGVMLSHIFYRDLDSEWPASLSKKIAKDLLRGNLGFNGVILTDDLDMGAIKQRYDIKTAVRQILLADIDIALICHKGPDIAIAHEEIVKAIHGEVHKEATVYSIERILKLKQKYIAG